MSVSVRVVAFSFWTDRLPISLRRTEISPCAMAWASSGEEARAVTSIMRLFVGFDSVTAPLILL